MRRSPFACTVAFLLALPILVSAGLGPAPAAAGPTPPAAARGFSGPLPAAPPDSTSAPEVCPDADADGYTDAACGGLDCDDTNPNVHPGATEVCNGIDDDCNGITDDNAAGGQAYYADADADGYGDAGATVLACSPPPGYVSDDTDCDDTDPAVHPGATEVCNGIDDDCNGITDDNAAGGQAYYADADADGYGDAGVTVLACSPPPGYVSDDTDCDDSRADVYPGAPELLDGVDNDCDGQVDEGLSFDILAVADVGNDQGRQVRVRWSPHPGDAPGSPTPITGYGIYRKVQAGLAPGVLGAAATPPGDWDYVLSVPATGETVYQTVVPTLCDSNDVGVCWSTFFLRAFTATPTTYYDSVPDSGYSVDNLSPAAPANLSAAYASGTFALSWDEVADADLAGYRIYRSADASFIPSPSTRVDATTALSWTDPSPDGSETYYKVTAVDFNGNESAPASPVAVTGVGERPDVPGPVLRAGVPNPFRSATSIAFELPGSGARVDLRIFSATGKQVRVLASGSLAAGLHRVTWDGRDGGGVALPAGIYYVRLVAGDAVRSGRLVLLK